MTKAPPLTIRDFCLIVDDRENAVYPHLECEAVEINYLRKRITVGDYALMNMRTKQIVVVFERKELKDFASSLKDGRYQNKRSMIELRQKTNCRIVYIIEGPMNPKQTDTFNHCPWAYIESAIFHLMIRDNILPMYTLNTQDTIAKLIRFMKSMINLLNADPLDFKDEITTTTTEDGEILETSGLEDIGGGSFEVPSSLTSPIVKSDIEIVRNMWSTFKGISVVSADLFITNFTLADLVRGRVNKTQLEAFKTTSGKRLSAPVLQSLLGIINGDREVEIRLLASIPGISKTTADEILTGDTSLNRLLSYEAGSISIIPIGKRKSALGLVRAERILKYFNYRQQINCSINAENESTAPPKNMATASTTSTALTASTASTTTPTPTRELSNNIKITPPIEQPPSVTQQPPSAPANSSIKLDMNSDTLAAAEALIRAFKI